MITAVDTKVLLDVLIPNQEFADRSTKALRRVESEGSLVICDFVYAELCVHFEVQRDCDTFLKDNDIRVEPLTPSTLFLASRAWRRYRLQGGKRNRIMGDFLIGAHAQAQAARLLSRDRGFYHLIFPSLALVDTSQERD